MVRVFLQPLGGEVVLWSCHRVSSVPASVPLGDLGDPDRQALAGVAVPSPASQQRPLARP
jgi:hypothetical protein